MTTSRPTAVLVLALATLAAMSSVSCTAILAPRDEVQRCGTADDCEPTGDNRYVPVCKFDEANIDLDSSQVDKICVADFKLVGCDSGSYTNPEHPFKVAVEDLGDSSRYRACDATQLGAQGCPPMADGRCVESLVLNDVGVCDDTESDTPMAVLAETEELLGQDVRDQFCRSYFCDDTFVCDSDSNTCVQCDAEEPYGQGGCGEIWVAGNRSCVYDDGDACEGPDASDTKVTFGCGG